MSTFKDKTLDSSHPFLKTSLSKGDKGDPAIFVMPSPQIIGIPTESDGSSPDYTLAESNLSVIKSGEVIADESNANGFTATIESITGGTGSFVGLYFSLDSITAARGRALISISKAGYTTMYAIIDFMRVPKGETGDTGDTGPQGDAGATGATGLAGEDGDGVVILKKDVNFYAPERSVDISNDSGARLTRTDHHCAVGEIVQIDSGTYAGEYEVSEVIDDDNFRLDGLVYSVDESTTFTNLSHFRNTDNHEQDIKLPGIIPAKYLPFKMVIYENSIETATSAAIALFMGEALYDTVGWNDYLSGEIFDGGAPGLDEHVIIDVSDKFINIHPTAKHIYFHVTTYPSRIYDFDDFDSLSIRLMIVCYNFA